VLQRLIRSAFTRQQPAAPLASRAVEHYERGELDKAEECFREIALGTPADDRAWANWAAVLMRQQKHAAALPVLLRLVELQPDLAEAHLDLGTCYNRLRKNRDAILHYEHAIELKPELHKAHANVLNAYLDSCDWDNVEAWATSFLEYKRSHPAELWTERLQPFCALSLFPGKIAKQLATYKAQKVERSVSRFNDSKVVKHSRKNSRIRIGYVSSDFYAHATAHLTYSLYGAHDRSQFEVFAYSMGPDDGSEYRKNIERTCDEFADVRFETAEQTARRIKADGVDILVDMKGYTSDSRPEIFAFRPAPVQVNYLGYPGTSGARYMDYFISDGVATPRGYENEFTESIVRLPGSYQVNDNRQRISAETVSRAEFNLPEQSFVFCSFNRPRKIDRTIFSRWMRILDRVPKSVLWLIGEDTQAEVNLKREAASKNIDPQRLIFAPQAEKPLHLARHRLADLFLDTYNYNAHTGTSDALWAGLPVLTCPGSTFATRVAASLLSAAELPDLIARDLDHYENLAVQFGCDPGSLAAVKSKLANTWLTCALFDTPRYVKHLETAYIRMIEISEANRPPESFDV
jgi:protein O-GlcNAc transferase